MTQRFTRRAGCRVGRFTRLHDAVDRINGDLRGGSIVPDI